MLSFLPKRRILNLSSLALVSSYVNIQYMNNTNTLMSASNEKNNTNKNFHSLSKKEWREFPILSIKQITHDTKVFCIELPSPDHDLGLETASSITIQGVDSKGKEVSRPYTPISPSSQTGYFDLLIKVYPDGNVSQYMNQKDIGDTVKVKGPWAKIKYEPNKWKKIGMIAGGSGITPMLQVILEILNNPDDHTEILLVFANKTQEDILLKAYLDELARNHDNFNIHYVIDEETENWEGSVGHINQEIIERELPSSDEEDSIIFVCGPPGMMKAISGGKKKVDGKMTQGPIKGILGDLGFNNDTCFKF